MGGEDFAWITRGDLITLQTMANAINTTYTLRFNGEVHTVRFRHEEPPVISAEPLVERINHTATDWYKNLYIKLMETF
jgi:hypothetical protein